MNVDPLRSPARIVGTRVVSVCRACPAAPAPEAAASVAENIAVAGAVAPRVEAPSRGAGRMPFVLAVLALGGAAALVAVVRPGLSSAVSAPRPPPAPPPAPPAPAAIAPAPELPPPVTPQPPAPARRPRVPGLPAGECVFPLPSTDRAFPVADDRVFGADRPGETHAPECGGGHCGVDLADAEGTPVLVVRDGTVDKVVRNGDDKGGRWVLVRHAGGMSTWYMHLDEVRSDLAPNVRVKAGESLGTLGHSGIRNSPAHLHFAITMNDGSGETHVDPMPFLRRAVAVDPPPARIEPSSAAIAPAL
jgi:murein DD-endopeptidase MepM/ murein hydrolase activator NlpD